MPVWAVGYLPRWRRPRQSWTIERCLRVRFMQSLGQLVARCEIDYLGDDLTVQVDPLKLKYSHPVMVPPVPLDLLRGHPAEMLALLHDSRGSWDPHFIYRRHRDRPGAWGSWNAVNHNEVFGPEPVRCFWYNGDKINATDAESSNTSRYKASSSVPRECIVRLPVKHVLSVDYRLAPQAPWPLPLIDAISAYRFLVIDEGISESDIIVTGDSAGGHLALALVRWLRDEQKNVGLRCPRGIVLFSPWVDVGFTNTWGDEGWNHNLHSDTIHTQFGTFATSLLLRALPASTMHFSPYLSPSSLLLEPQPSGPNSFEEFPPAFIVYGGAERIARTILTLWDRLQLAREAEGLTGVDELVEGVDSVHDFIIDLWQAEEAGIVYDKLDVWLQNLLRSDGAARTEGLECRVEGDEYEPLISPNRQGVFSMMQDVIAEGRGIRDPEPLDLHLVDRARELLSPLKSAFSINGLGSDVGKATSILHADWRDADTSTDKSGANRRNKVTS